MTTSKRYVVDTNVLVSALLFADSKPARVVFTVLAHSTLLISVATLQELDTVLHRRKFDRYLTVEEREAFLLKLALTATMIDIGECVQACRDPKDDTFLDVAINGMADGVITGDPDLLVLHPFRGIAILTPDAFLTELVPNG